MKAILFAATTNPKASRYFYENTLGLSFVADHPFAVVFETEGITLRVQKVEQVVTVPCTTLGFEVSDIRASVADLNSTGVSFEQFEFMQQDESGIWITPDGAMVAWRKDPDGSMISLAQMPA